MLHASSTAGCSGTRWRPRAARHRQGAIALVAATGMLSRAVDFFVIDTSGAWSAVADVVADLGAQPVFLTAQVLLVVGAVRAMTNLVPPAEFEADY